jgi:hypothetical protein
MNAVESVRATCSFVMQHAQSVHVVESAISELIFDSSKFPSDVHDALSKVQWDSCGWHFNGDASCCGDMTAQYILVLDALNFCFWPCPGLEYEHLAIGLKRVLEQDPTAFSAKKLIDVDEQTLHKWIPGWDIPSIEERVQRVREVGHVLLQGGVELCVVSLFRDLTLFIL